MVWKHARRMLAVGLAAAVWGGPAAFAEDPLPAPKDAKEKAEPPKEMPKDKDAATDAPPPAVPPGPQATLSGIPCAGGECGAAPCGVAGCGASCGLDCTNAPFGCGEGGCYPGRDACSPFPACGRVGRLYAAFHNAICCPDPCYVPQWQCAANAAFFVDHARPTTMTRIRWDAGRGLVDPDRADYFWGRIGVRGPANPERRVDYHELHIYQEAGADRFSAFIDLPFRSTSTANNGGSGGIGDLRIGTKSLLLDSELLQFTFQFATTLPTGASGGGLGIGSVSLDPSLVMAVKLREDTYWQSQLGYWFIPAGGDGGLVHYHNALNHVFLRPTGDTALIGTFETVGWTFTGGRVTNATLPLTTAGANGTTYFTLGPGVRWCMCNKVDLGFGVQFAVTDRHFADQLYRTEIRFRF